MLSTLVLCSGLIAALPTAGERAEYEAARARAGRDADAHVKLALWCEQHGMTAARARHLALAVLINPRNAVARGLMGFVQFQGGWRRPDDVAAKVKADAERAAKFAAYAERRARTRHTADGQWKLALWCEQSGLNAEALAHCSAVLRHDPNHAGARKRLGYKKHGGRWATDAQLAREKAEAEAQHKADRYWKPRLVKWCGALGDSAKRDAVVRALEEVTDPRAVPSIWEVFAASGERNQTQSVQLFGQIQSPGASRALAMLAITSPWPNVRTRATEVLRRRDAREYVGMLIGFVRKPMKYEIRRGSGPDEMGELFVEGERYNIRRTYRAWRLAQRFGLIPGRLFADSVPFEPFSPQTLLMASMPLYEPAVSGLAPYHGGAPQQSPAGNMVADLTVAAARRDVQIGMMQFALQEAIDVSRQQLMGDVAAVEALNAEIKQVNSQVLPVLNTVTGQDFGESQDDWMTWWSDQRGLVYSVPTSAEVPTFTEIVDNPLFPFHTACFGRGTLVRTIDGSQAIESLCTGDQVLTQDARTGALSFQSIVAVYHNRPAPTLRLTLGSETVIVTGIHRFWKAGQGWIMARELKTGDSLRTVGGVATVSAIEDAPVQSVFNLEVASGQSFFVGKQGALVHDNSLVQPVTEPFDAPTEISLATKR